MANRGRRATRRIAIGVRTGQLEKRRVPGERRVNARRALVLDGARNEMGRGNPGRAPVELDMRPLHRSSHELTEEALPRVATSGRGGCGSSHWGGSAKSARA
jgi:hypothetical protein